MNISETARRKHDETMADLVRPLGIIKTAHSGHFIHEKSGIKLDLSATAFNQSVIINKLIDLAIEEGKKQARIEIRRIIAIE